MARISLRAYNRDLEVMIDKNQIDEAFAHCRYILELYPKHIDTYRLMGKALLEAQRFSDASDIFHRVLSSVPDDFIAHLGMSIIREDESNLDAAIWHMERSFEVQPSNAAVQVELRRLYGLRDGVTPQKIQLTRGALARMSAKSNLHSQAIAELRSALSNDPQRPDLQVVLAEMYRQTGARMEAIEACNALINKLPYCLTANRILAEVLPETERADQAHVYKTRIGELDPYYLQLSPVAPTLEQVPDGAVTIERFEYDGESFTTTEKDQPAWAASLGVDLDDEQADPGEPAPDWLQGSESAPATAAEITGEADAEPETGKSIEESSFLPGQEQETLEDDEIPDWMSEIGERDAESEPVSDIEAEVPISSDEEFDVSKVFTSETEPAQEGEQVPDWMHDADDSEENDDNASIPGAVALVGAAALGAVIDGHEDDEPEPEAKPDIEPGQEYSAESESPAAIPDLMAEAQNDDDPPGSEVTSETEDESEEKDDSASISGAAAAAGAAALGAVIAGQEDDEPDPEAEADLEADQEIPAEEESPASIPDWMAEAQMTEDESGSVEDEIQPEDESEIVAQAADESEQTPDWVSGADPGADGETPDWLRAAMEGTSEPGEHLKEAGTLAVGAAISSDDESGELLSEPSEEMHAEAKQSQETGAETEDPVDTDGEEDRKGHSTAAGIGIGAAAAAGTAAIIGAVMDEDEEMSADIDDQVDLPAPEGLASLSTIDESVDESEQDIPDWLQDLGEDLPAAEPGDDPPVVFEEPPADGEPIPIPAMETSPEEPQSEGADETSADEVESIPGISDAQDGEIFEESEYPESIPEWLSEVSPEEIPEEVAEAEAEVDIVRAEIPVWLRKMEAQHKAELEADGEVDSIEELELDAEFTELSGEDVPSWLMSAMEPELPAGVDDPKEVEDISQVFEVEEPVAIDEFGLESTAEEAMELDQEVEKDEQEIEFADLQEELAPLDGVPEAVMVEGADALEELDSLPEQVDELLAPEDEAELESMVAHDDLDPDDAEETEEVEDLDEGIGLTGLAAAGAAGAVAAHLFDEEDTQPVQISAEPEQLETGELDAEQIVEAEVEILAVEEGFSVQVPETEEELSPTLEVDESETPAFAADTPLSGEDQDAAMAWLESLAAKQGASEEELLTPADERLEEPPQWVQEQASEVGDAEDEQDEERELALTAAALAGVTAGILAEDEEPTLDEIETQPGAEETIDMPSEWVPEIIDEEVQVTEPGTEEIEIEPEVIEIEEEPKVIEELASAAEVDLDQVEDIDTSGEIPDWLSGLAEEQETAELESKDWTPDMLAEEADQISTSIDDVPAEKLDLNAATLAQLEKVPGIGFIVAQNIVNHRAQSGSFTDLEQLGEVEGLTPDMTAELEDYLIVEVVTEVSTIESDLPELQAAWKDISENNIDSAVDQYTELINQDLHLDEVIRDLHAAINKYPDDSVLYQTLGDAYMHSNMLQEALDAYNRAEDLIK